MFSKFYSNDKKFIDEYYMSISDLKTMSNNGMIIGGHSYSHPFLNKLPFDEIKNEIDKSMFFLRNTVNKEINSFAQFYALPFNKMLETKYQEFHLKIEKSNSPTIGDKTGTDRIFSSTKTLKNFLNG